MRYSTDSGKLPKVWAESCAQIIETIDSPGLPHILAESLRTLISYEACRTIVFRLHTSPMLIYDSESNAAHKAGWDNYLGRSYAISPIYRLYKAGRLPGVHRVRDIAYLGSEDMDPALYRVSVVKSEEAGYLTEGLPAGNEELCIGLELPDGSGAQIALTRKQTARGYSSEELALTNAAKPVLASALKQYWKNRIKSFDPTPETALRNGIFHRLSPREFEITQLLINGHSSLSVSLLLGISTTTVKTHRKNLYSKLGIATHFELFSLYIKEMKRNNSHN